MTARPLSTHRRPLAVALVAAVLLVFVAAVPGAAADDPPPGGGGGTALKSQYDAVLVAEQKLEAAIAVQAKRMIEIGTEINALQQELSEVGLQLEAAQRRLRQAVADDIAARAALAAAKRRMSLATEALHAQAVSAYIGGGSSGPDINTFLDSFDDGTQMERASSYASAVVQHQRAVVTEFRAARAARAVASRRAASSKTGATAIRDAIGKTQRDLSVKRLQMEQLKVDAANAADLQQAAKTKLLSKKVEIEARISLLDKASDGIGGFLAAEQKGQPAWVPDVIAFQPPLPGVKPGSPFGMRFHPILHYTRLHAGIDFGVGTGTPIHAAADGIVVIAGERGGYGNAVVIDHGHTLATVYAHQSRIVAQVGQQVKAGDIIGYVGATGLATGPHLHFETRVKGTPVNPTTFIDFGAVPEGTETGD